jgi:hypothetical protein
MLVPLEDQGVNQSQGLCRPGGGRIVKEISGYPKIYSLGHRAIRDIFKEPVTAQEKVDGSQISFMKKDGAVYVRSKGAMLYFENPEKMFSLGMTQIALMAPKLVDGWIYRGEYLRGPKHNVLSYDRLPKRHIIIYDIQVGDQEFLNQIHMTDAANDLGLEAVPGWYLPADIKQEDIAKLMLEVSVLGGVPVEGIVFKNYNRFDQYTGKVMMGKHVSEAFREVHRSKKYKTTGKDRIQMLVEQYRTEARWQKAAQHLRDVGGLTDSPKDIGQLIKFVTHDVLEECREEIADALFKWGWKQISRGITAGLPEWYKEQLLQKQFETQETPPCDSETCYCDSKLSCN